MTNGSMRNMVKINLGCGLTYHPEWKNFDFLSYTADVVQHDLRTGIPFENGTVDIVYHSHVLEHFSKDDALHFLRECHRVLKPNGLIRIAVPDLEGICRAYLAALDAVRQHQPNAQNDHEWMIIELIDQMTRSTSGGAMGRYWSQDMIANEAFIYQRLGEEFSKCRAYLKTLPAAQRKSSPVQKPRWQERLASILTGYDVKTLQHAAFLEQGEVHKWMYDSVSLERTLAFVGFKDIKTYAPGDSRLSEWSSYELEIRDGKILKPDSLIVEAIKA